MGWLDSFFGSGSGSGSADHRRYGDNEYYQYPRSGSGGYSGGSGGWQGGSSSGGWQGPNIFEDPYASAYPSHGGGYPYQDSGRSSYQDIGPSYQSSVPSYQSSGRSNQDNRHPYDPYGYMGSGSGGYPQDGGSFEPSYPSYPARRSIEEDKQSSKGAPADDDESEEEADGDSDAAEELSRGVETLNLRYPTPQVTSIMAPYHPNLMSASRFEGMKTCAGCSKPLGNGRHLTTMGRNWHPGCFCCGACDKAIVDREGDVPYHRECYKKSFHPKCTICRNFIPPNSKGLIEYRSHPFWDQKYCPSHERDGRRRCCSCDRIETVDEQYTSLGDGRKVCSECMETNIMNTQECQPFYRDILKFYKTQDMSIDQEIPMLLVARDALNNAREAEKDEHIHAPETRGLCLSEEQTITTVFGTSPDQYGYHHETQNRKLTRHCEVTAILVLFGLPRLLTGSILVHELMHAWIRLDGKFPNLDNDIEEGLCQVIAHIWLEQELDKLMKKGSGASPATKRLGEFFKHQIETDSSPIYGDGFRNVNASVQAYGLKRTIDHLRDTGRLLH